MQVIPFSFQESTIRVITDDGTEYWVAKDMCDALGYTNHNKAIGDHCKGVTKRYPLQTPGGVQEVRVLAEPDVLRLIIGSTLPAAQAFERWVFEEVLPQIRKTGKYEVPASPQAQQMSLASQLVDLAPRMLIAIEAFGIHGNAATISVNQALTKLSGINFLEITGNAHLIANGKGLTYTPTQLGATLDSPMSGRYVNDLLRRVGLQQNTAAGWAPTTPGECHGEWYDTGKRHGDGAPVKQWKWFGSVLEYLTI